MKKSQIAPSLLNVLLISGLCFGSFVSTTNCFAATVTKKLNLTIVSGDYESEAGDATVTYDDSKITGIGKEEINDGTSITFHFLGQTATGQPTIILKNGKFSGIFWMSFVDTDDDSIAFVFNDKSFKRHSKKAKFLYESDAADGDDAYGKIVYSDQ